MKQALLGDFQFKLKGVGGKGVIFGLSNDCKVTLFFGCSESVEKSFSLTLEEILTLFRRHTGRIYFNSKINRAFLQQNDMQDLPFLIEFF